MKEYFLYRHVRLDTNVPFYVGIGTKPKNFSSHKPEYRRAYSKEHRNNFWVSIISKTDYKVDILFETTSKNLILQKETEFINLYGRRNLQTGSLVNMTDGGEYHCAGMRNCKGDRKPITNETRKKMSQVAKERKSYLQICTPEVVKKVVKTRRKQAPSVVCLSSGLIYESLGEACEKLGLDYKGEHQRLRLNISTKKFDYLEENKTTSSIKGKQTLRNKAKRVQHLETGMIYNSLMDACEILNLKYPTEYQRIEKNLVKVKFKYLDEERSSSNKLIKTSN